MVLGAVMQRGFALQWAELRADRDVVLSAVRKNGGALRYTSAELKADQDVVAAAVQQTVHALQFASAELRASFDVIWVN